MFNFVSFVNAVVSVFNALKSVFISSSACEMEEVVCDFVPGLKGILEFPVEFNEGHAAPLDLTDEEIPF